MISQSRCDLRMLVCMNRGETDWKRLGAAAWWMFIAPALVYLLIERTLYVHTETQQMLVVLLALAGMITAFARD